MTVKDKMILPLLTTHHFFSASQRLNSDPWINFHIPRDSRKCNLPIIITKERLDPNVLSFYIAKILWNTQHHIYASYHYGYCEKLTERKFAGTRTLNS